MKKINKKVVAMLLIATMIFTIAPVSGSTAEAATKKPTKVTGVKVKQKGAKKLKVTWKKAKRAKKYIVYMKTGSKKWKRAKVTKAKSYTTKSLKKGVTYRFKIKSVSKYGKKAKCSKTVKKKLKSTSSSGSSSPSNVDVKNPKPMTNAELKKCESDFQSSAKKNLVPNYKENFIKNAIVSYSTGASVWELLGKSQIESDYSIGYYERRCVYEVGKIKKGYVATYTLGTPTNIKAPTINSTRLKDNMRVKMNHSTNTYRVHIYKDGKLVAYECFTQGDLYCDITGDTWVDWPEDMIVR